TLSPKASEAADIEGARAFAATALGDAFAAVLDRAAVIAMVTALIVQIGRLRLRRPPRVANDLDGMTRHCRLRWPSVFLWPSVVSAWGGVHPAGPQSGFSTVSSRPARCNISSPPIV